MKKIQGMMGWIFGVMWRSSENSEHFTGPSRAVNKSQAWLLQSIFELQMTGHEINRA
ncbi:MAG TPA: hypothetical protein PKE26_00875 [Kiritimatiellia bacterium]|nr:hypothetical protein [Kiritimatiellia bacterium]HMO97646.1 hypothetical protein [Kiritimatiellia bacterium]